MICAKVLSVPSSAALATKLVAEKFSDPAVPCAYYLLRANLWNGVPPGWFDRPIQSSRSQRRRVTSVGAAPLLLCIRPVPQRVDRRLLVCGGEYVGYVDALPGMRVPTLRNVACGGERFCR
jgi:hypothetical protein